MSKIATVRLQEGFLKELSKFIKEMKLDKSSYLREIIKKGFEHDRQERLLDKYRNGEIAMGELCAYLNKQPWDFLELLKVKNQNLNVTLEDWLDSKKL
jgi:metal-responsive CopG/Arc/MetJ family transcriptional regulator